MAEQFAAGRLTHGLASGSTLADLPAGAPARARGRPSPPLGQEPVRAGGQERRLAEAEQVLHRLEAEERAAATALDHARTQAEHATEQRRASQERLRQAEQALDQARGALRSAEDDAARTQDELAAAGRRAEQLRARLEEQQVTVDGLRQD